ncbi:hypothetical protein K440DRAFT_300457 [Wilcoxina mikolae CBS 423.85]|nr:hypothetical protein K440DRAFT_300457 [Wilcoxina mikolae CBS 423.85]
MSRTHHHLHKIASKRVALTPHVPHHYSAPLFIRPRNARIHNHRDAGNLNLKRVRRCSLLQIYAMEGPGTP